MLLNINLALFNRVTWKNVLAREDVYNRAPVLAAEFITQGAFMGDCGDETCQIEPVTGLADLVGLPSSYLNNLDRAGWESIFTILLSPDYVRTQTESIIDQIFDGLDTPSRSSDLTISIANMRNELTDQEYQKLAQTVLVYAPVCSADELLTLGAILLGVSSADLPFCTPTEELRPLLENGVNMTIHGVIQALPDVLTIDAGMFTNAAAADMAKPQTAVPAKITAISPQKWIWIAFLIFTLLAVVSLALLVAAAVRSWHDAGRWVGVPFVITGMLVMIIAALLLVSIPWVLSGFIFPLLIPQINPGLIDIIQNVVQGISVRFVFWSALPAGILFLTGAALFVISIWLKPQQT